jgi:hypothetical protein
LREIANMSARTAVAAHSTRKLRQAVTFMLPLTIVAFVLAAGMYVMGGEEGRFASQAFGTVMLGAIAALEVMRTGLKMVGRGRGRTVAEVKSDAPAVKRDPRESESISPDT